MVLTLCRSYQPALQGDPGSDGNHGKTWVKVRNRKNQDTEAGPIENIIRMKEVNKKRPDSRAFSFWKSFVSNITVLPRNQGPKVQTVSIVGVFDGNIECLP